jgi:hypothetical protein
MKGTPELFILDKHLCYSCNLLFLFVWVDVGVFLNNKNSLLFLCDLCVFFFLCVLCGSIILEVGGGGLTLA